MEAVHPLEAGGSSLGNTKRSARHGVILKGVGAKVRNEWYEGLVKNGTEVTKNKEREILEKIHETDPWYKLKSLTIWVGAQRKRAKKEAGEEAQSSTSFFVKVEGTSSWTTFPAHFTTACVSGPTSTPAPIRSAFHVALDNIPLGNDADIQKLAREFGVDAAVLTRYHFLYRTCKTSVEGGFAEPALTYKPMTGGKSCEMDSTTSTARDSMDGDIPQKASQIQSTINTMVDELSILPFTSNPPNHCIPQTFEQFSAHLEPYESALDRILEIMDQYS